MVWESANGIASSKDESLPNVAIYSGEVTAAEVLPGQVSEALDVSHPSTRLKLSSAGLSERCALAALIVPLKPRLSPEVEARVKCVAEKEGWVIRFVATAESTPLAVFWRPAQFLEFA